MKYIYVFFEMQQAPLQVRPENTFATKATRGYTKQQEEFYTQTLDLLLAYFYWYHKTKNVDSLATLNFFMSHSDSSSSDSWKTKARDKLWRCELSIFHIQQTGRMDVKGHEKGLTGLTCFALAPCHFLGSKLQVCKEPFPMTSLPQISVCFMKLATKVRLRQCMWLL